MGADREENDGRTIPLLKGRQVDRAMPHRKRVAGIHATIERTTGPNLNEELAQDARFDDRRPEDQQFPCSGEG
jgi:hypothetical protein